MMMIKTRLRIYLNDPSTMKMIAWYGHAEPIEIERNIKNVIISLYFSKKIFMLPANTKIALIDKDGDHIILTDSIPDGDIYAVKTYKKCIKQLSILSSEDEMIEQPGDLSAASRIRSPRAKAPQEFPMETCQAPYVIPQTQPGMHPVQSLVQPQAAHKHPFSSFSAEHSQNITPPPVPGTSSQDYSSGRIRETEVEFYYNIIVQIKSDQKYGARTTEGTLKTKPKSESKSIFADKLQNIGLSPQLCAKISEKNLRVMAPASIPPYRANDPPENHFSGNFSLFYQLELEEVD